MKSGFHTDAFNSAYWNFEKCVQWAREHDLHWIECGLIDGVSWIHGLGYQPLVALPEDPLLLRRKMERLGVRFSQLDAAYPLSGKDGPLYGVPYVLRSIPWAKHAGCERMECEGQGGPMIDRSLSWLRSLLRELRIAEEA